MHMTVTYLEKPVTETEKKLAWLIERLVEGFNTKNPKVIMSVFHPRARLCVPLKNEERYLARDEYVEKFMNSERIRRISYEDVIIRTPNEKNAFASYICRIFLKNSNTPLTLHRNFKFIKEEGSWHVESITPA